MKILVVIWDDGTKEEYAYRDEDRAERTMNEMQKVFGEQISYMYIK